MKRPRSSGRKLLYELYHLLWLSIDLLLPPRCGGCGQIGSRWCPKCSAAVVLPQTPICQVCGRPIEGPGQLCAACEHSRPHFSALRAWSVYADPTRAALLKLKYRGDMGLAESLIPQLAAFAAGLAWQVNLIVPVPLGRDRQRQRGYNQAGLISWPLSLALDVRHAPHALMRTRETPSQVGLSRQERRENMRAAFAASGRLVHARSILLVDDVATTGATLSSCAEALLAAGARDVFALTVARAHQDREDGAASRGSVDLRRQ